MLRQPWEQTTGIEVRTAFNIVSFPARERKREDQLDALWRILSTMEVNKSLFFLPKCSGRPKYFPEPPSFPIPRISIACAFISGEVFLEKVTDDFKIFSHFLCDWQKGSATELKIVYSTFCCADWTIQSHPT